MLALLVIGIALIAYPLVGSYMEERESAQVIANYDEKTAKLAADEVQAEFDAADAYNEALSKADVELTDPFDPSTIDDAPASYDDIFNTEGNGVMGYLEIPKIDVMIPIYHGTGNDVLQQGAGHMSNTSLPTGKPGTHAVFAAHTALPRARMFTDLPQLKEGDVFYLHILGRTLAYEVDQISIVEPQDSSKLAAVEGKNYVTLLTCYPYGINTHRLLVRGVGVPYEEAQAAEGEPAQSSIWMTEYLHGIALCLAVYIPLVALIVYVVRRRRRDGGAAAAVAGGVRKSRAVRHKPPARHRQGRRYR